MKIFKKNMLSLPHKKNKNMRTEKQAEKIAEKILSYTKTYQTTKAIIFVEKLKNVKILKYKKYRNDNKIYHDKDKNYKALAIQKIYFGEYLVFEIFYK